MSIELQKALNAHQQLSRLHHAQLQHKTALLDHAHTQLEDARRQLRVRNQQLEADSSRAGPQQMQLAARFCLCSAVLHYNRQAEHPYDELQDFQSAKLSASSFNCPLKNDENSNTENYEYQFSEMLEKEPIIHKLSEAILPRRESCSKKSGQRITITYGHPNYVQTHQKEKLIAQSSSNRSYDHLIQYKKRFMGQLPRNGP
jgi:hypothetical protein